MGGLFYVVLKIFILASRLPLPALEFDNTLKPISHFEGNDVTLRTIKILKHYNTHSIYYVFYLKMVPP